MIRRLFSFLSRLTDHISIGANTLGSLVVLFVVLVVNLEVIQRSLFDAPIHGIIEIVEISIVSIVFLQLADVVRTGRMTRSDAVLIKLGMIRPMVGSLLRRFFDLMAAVFMVLLLFATIPELVEAWEEDAFVGTEGVFTLPEWPIRAIVVFGTTLCFTRWALSAVLPAAWMTPIDDTVRGEESP
jgi:TRAP-type mannitol/chloroaromatic compound transport system permease small subunit